MRPRQIIGWLTPLAAVALVLGSGPSPAPAAVCVTVTPGIDLGCRDEQGAPAVTYAANKGVVVVAAAGNAGVTTQFFPAADPHAVSATPGRTSAAGCVSPPRGATSPRFSAAATATSAAPRPPHRSLPVWLHSS